MGIAYCTREDVTSALGFDESARLNTAVDRAVQAASRSVEGLLHRKFYPSTETRAFQRSSGRRIWLEDSEVVSVSSLTAAGSLIAAANYALSPNTGPPYTSIDVPASLGTGPDDDVLISADFGHSAAQRTAGTLAVAISSTSATTLTVSDGSLVGVGDLLTIDSERLQVTGRTWATSPSQTGSLTASKADRSLVVTTASAYKVGERLLIDAERLLVADISGNTLIVDRAVDGTVLAAHTTASVFTSRLLTVERAAAGTTAATHLISAPVTALAPPALVRSLTIAEAINLILQESSGYARTIGSGESVRNAGGAGLTDLRNQAYAELGRKARMQVI